MMAVDFRVRSLFDDEHEQVLALHVQRR
jgi:hypothetical protein